MNYCLPIICRKSDDVLRLIEAEEVDYRFFEVWLDHLEDYSFEEAAKWCSRFGDRLIVLFRRPRLEPIRMPLAERCRIIEHAAVAGSYIDLDIGTQQEELAFVASLHGRLRLILSFHDYEATPSDDELAALLMKMRESGAAICKFACFCRSPEDALRLLMLQRRLAAEGSSHIVLGMGEHGAITRIFGALWGNELTFAPVAREEASAPGQFTRAELERIFTILKR